MINSIGHNKTPQVREKERWLSPKRVISAGAIPKMASNEKI
jgi:hypothetical protein